VNASKKSSKKKWKGGGLCRRTLEKSYEMGGAGERDGRPEITGLDA